MGRLTGKVVLITGAAQGIGAEYAKGVAEEGALVIIADLADSAGICSDLNAHGYRARGFRLNVTDRNAVCAMVDDVASSAGTIDVLVNNAALFSTLKMTRFEDISSAEWSRVMDVNVRGTFECCRAVVPVMRKHGGGKIINIASAIAFKGTPMMLHYVTSKGAIVSMTRALAREVGGDGITVNALAPGLVLTEAIQAHPDWQGDTLRNNTRSRALQRTEGPADLVGPLLMLATSPSDFMTGQTLVVDGGSVMR